MIGVTVVVVAVVVGEVVGGRFDCFWSVGLGPVVQLGEVEVIAVVIVVVVLLVMVVAM